MKITRTRVMIVAREWEEGIRLADSLASNGYQPVLVRSVDAAAQELSGVRPQAIIVLVRSWAAPNELAATELVRLTQTVCPQVPVITVSEPADGHRLPPVVRGAARHCLTKPLSFSDLDALLQNEVRPSYARAPFNEHRASERTPIPR